MAECPEVFDASPGSLLTDRYCLIAKLGQGGMGAVWRAEDRALNIEVAIKLIDPALVESPLAMARFQQEAHAAARLRSTHIVHINDYGVDDASGQPYIAMDLLEGESLQQRLDREGHLPFAELQHILSQVARGLELAHSKGIVHRDLKPENVFIAREGGSEVVKVLDFGIAKSLGELERSAGLKTGDGQVLGTPYYMSPEQAKAMSSVDHRTDIWAFGVIAFEAATGFRPFEGENLASLVLSICSGTKRDPADFAAVPIGFTDWFARAAAQDCQQRFQSISAASAALAALTGAPFQQRARAHGAAPTLDVAIASSNSDVTMASSAVATQDFARAPRRAYAWAAAALSLLGVTAGAWWMNRTFDSASPTITTAKPAPHLLHSGNAPAPSTSSAGTALSATSSAGTAPAPSSSPPALATSTSEHQPPLMSATSKSHQVKAPAKSEHILDPGI